VNTLPRVQIIRSVRAMQRQALSWRVAGVRVGYVPTMGWLHAGHLSLVRRARRVVGTSGKVVVSVYVNPTQFAPDEDLESYPRDLRRDARLCREGGVDVVFAPEDRGMYAGGPGLTHSTYVVEEHLAKRLEGSTRPTHFRGVTTVVAKLLHLVMPDVTVLGEKDYQQAAIVRRMVRDLNFPVRVLVAPTVRETDGLAMSSRNHYLSPEERRQAVVLWEAGRQARLRVRERPRGVPARSLAAELSRVIHRRPAARVDYVAFVDPDTLEPLTTVRPGSRLLLAAWFGRTRLIDNARL
jgi:pantoate--beta-alanine ligase